MFICRMLFNAIKGCNTSHTSRAIASLTVLVIMPIRQLCRQTSRRPSNALFYFQKEQKTGSAPTRVDTEKQLDLTVGMLVTVNWDGDKVEAEILALDGKSRVLLLHVTRSIMTLRFIFSLCQRIISHFQILRWKKHSLTELLTNTHLYNYFFKMAWTF